MTDRSGVKQPVGQKFLTNVAVVRHRAKGQEYQVTPPSRSAGGRGLVIRLQVACYKNKLSSWRSGIETDLDEVLQVRDVFTDVVNGKRAKRSEVLQAFDLGDLDAVKRWLFAVFCWFVMLSFQVLKVMLSKGEFQLNEDEREQELESMFRDVSSLLFPTASNVTLCACLHHRCAEVRGFKHRPSPHFRRR
jgi:ribosome maturation protein SDO1